MNNLFVNLGLYILQGKKPVPASNIKIWAQFFDSDERIVAQDMIGDILISTVFLGIDHSFHFDNEESPVLFESMVFGGNELDGICQRYHTWSEAENGHKELINFIRKSRFKIINRG